MFGFETLIDAQDGHVIYITTNVFINEDELQYTFITSAGPGGQNVNKVATAVLLRFNLVENVSIPVEIRERMLKKLANKLTLKGDLLVKANRFRTQEKNKKDALERLQSLLRQAAIVPKKRKPTKPTQGSIERRLNQKKRLSIKKNLRQDRKMDE